MSNTDDEFQNAVNAVNNLNKKPSDENLLILYGLYKQATVGNCNITKPGIFDFKGKSKWTAWDKYSGMTQDNAKMNYIKSIQKLSE